MSFLFTTLVQAVILSLGFMLGLALAYVIINLLAYAFVLSLTILLSYKGYYKKSNDNRKKTK